MLGRCRSTSPGMIASPNSAIPLQLLQRHVSDRRGFDDLPPYFIEDDTAESVTELSGPLKLGRKLSSDCVRKSIVDEKLFNIWSERSGIVDSSICLSMRPHNRFRAREQESLVERLLRFMRSR